MLTQVVQTKL